MVKKKKQALGVGKGEGREERGWGISGLGRSK